ncbi:MAG: Lyzozyme M1 (1,4-beta-N-acetylmuramidase) [Eubacterium sp.]|nr:Lyzozyme M1 (1,4-beta-N-acetylmuramidase) [Eubacterium sp.]
MDYRNQNRRRNYDEYEEYDEYEDDEYEDDEYEDDEYEDDEYDSDEYEDDEGIRYSGPRQMSARDVKKQRTRKIVKLWIAFIIFLVVAAVAFMVISDRLYRGEPLKPGLTGSIIHFDADYSIVDVINDNHERYMKKAYVYAEGEYLKISAKVARNNIDFENDFAAGNGGYTYFMKDGAVSSSVAIDVSSYNPGVDWESVKASGVSSVMIRSGYRGYGEEATLVADKNFSSNFSGATAAGLKVGVYFFTQATTYDEGVEEAEFVISQLDGKSLEMPIAIDTENVDSDESARANGIDKQARTDAVKGFCETIKAAGYTPMIYANRNWFLTRLDIEQIGEYQFWLANYSMLDFPYHIEGMQYTPEGNVSGVPGNCDINVWFN